MTSFQSETLDPFVPSDVEGRLLKRVSTSLDTNGNRA